MQNPYVMVEGENLLRKGTIHTGTNAVSGYGNLGIYDELTDSFLLEKFAASISNTMQLLPNRTYSLKFEVEGVEANKIFVEVGTGFKT